MSVIKPSLPKGTRDFLPEQMLRRQFVMGTMQNIFEKYGYQPLETPSIEKLEVLSGKYGDEGEKLIFKVLRRGTGLEDLLRGEDWDPRAWQKIALLVRAAIDCVLEKISTNATVVEQCIPFAGCTISHDRLAVSALLYQKLEQIPFRLSDLCAKRFVIGELLHTCFGFS